MLPEVIPKEAAEMYLKAMKASPYGVRFVTKQNEEMIGMKGKEVPT